MHDPFIPKLTLGEGRNPFSLSHLANASGADFSGRIVKSQMSSSTPEVSFKSVMANTLSNVNQTLQAPDALMQEAMTTGNVDVHDVMIANAKAELAVNIAAQMTTKVIQAYDRILQIQV